MPDEFQPPQFDPATIADPAERAWAIRLLNFGEEVLAAYRALQEEVQRLRDENLRLKGEHGSPPRSGRKSGKGAAETGARGDDQDGPEVSRGKHSSEAARRRRGSGPSGRGRGKRRKRGALTVDRELRRFVARTGLPADAVSKGFQPHVVQEIIFRRDTVVYWREKFHSASERRTYLAPLPPGCRGGYGPGLRSFVLEAAYGANVTFPQLHGLLTRRGLWISKGTLSGMLTRGLEGLHAEAAAILEAGLRSAPWHQLDVTATPVGGEWHACHTLGNPCYRHFRTAESQTREAILTTLRGGRPARFRLDEAAFARLVEVGVGARIVANLGKLADGPEWDELTFTARLAERLPRLGGDTRAAILEAAAISAYRAAPDWPAVRCLLGDDAVQFRELTEDLGLCWVHDGRHYQKLEPGFASFRQELAAFREQYWDYYDQLLAYRQAPTPVWAAALAAEFDRLFGTEARYVGLSRCIERTRGNKEKLLLVLKHPELPLHNNDSELAARRRVIKRRVSHGPKSPEGARAWDTLHTLAATAARLGVNFADLLADRVASGNRVPWLPHLIAGRAAELNLGYSWEST